MKNQQEVEKKFNEAEEDAEWAAYLDQELAKQAKENWLFDDLADEEVTDVFQWDKWDALEEWVQRLV